MDHYGVIGNPIHHSLSPLVHRLFAAQTNQSLIFHPILVELDGLPEALKDFQKQGGKGLSITLPFKHRAFTIADECSDRAKLASAINAIRFNQDGSSYGDNTDGEGLLRDIIENIQISLNKKKILILGAGGAVRGILDPILQAEPSEVILINRTENKAFELAEQLLHRGPICACSMAQLKNHSFNLIINGTSSGLRDEVLDLPKEILNEDTFCYDLVYGKGLTPFLRWAKENNLKFSDGLGMLVEQAAETFHLWREIKPDTKPVLTALRDSMAVIV